MLEWVISSAVLTALVIALRFILKGKISLRLQYALWALVLLRLLVPVSFGATGLSVGNLTQKVAETEAVQTVSTLTQLDLPRMTYSVAYSEVAKEYAEKGIDIAEMPIEDFETVDYEILSRMGGEWSIRDVLKAVWLFGIVAVGLALLASNICFAAKLRRSRYRLDTQSCPLLVYVSPNVETPCLFGLFHPAIYITPEAAADETVLRHTVEHELTHFRHGDHIWSLLRGACLTLHWYNPLVWWAAVLSRNDAELACDEATIKRIGESERAEYGRTLIGMTCQKRPALLLTATTMTGSKSSIKERIMLIAKKPKTAIYTLIAVVLIAALAVGCTFTGARDSEDTPWAWAQGINTGRITSAVPWDNTGDFEKLTDTEIETLITLLNNLQQVDFTENTELVGGTPTYGLQIETTDGSFNINESIALAGALEIKYKNSQWWINNETLCDFILNLVVGNHSESKLESALKSAVINYMGTGWWTAESLPSSDFETAAFAELYRRNNDNIITLYGVCAYKGYNSNDETVSEFATICIIILDMNTGECMDFWVPGDGANHDMDIAAHFPTEIAQRLLQSDNFYDEFVQPLYDACDADIEAHLSRNGEIDNVGTLSPVDVIPDLFASGNVKLTLHLANDGAYNTYLASEWYVGRFEVLLRGYKWTEMEMPTTEPSDFWITSVSADGSKTMRFWSDSNAGTVQYSDGDTTVYWSASPNNDDSVSIAEDIRDEYDNLDVDYSRISFYLDGSAEDAADAFVHSAYGSHMMNLAPGNMYGMSDYDVVNWGVREVSEDDEAVVGWFECAFTPWDFDSPGIWAGNTGEATGQYEGKLTFSREFVLQRQDDSYWHCTDLGTGGASLPE